MASSARIDELRKKFEENPRRYFAPLANEYRKAGDIEQAISICREYLPQQPGHMSGHIVYGQALYEARQYEEARTVFETALALDPENLIALRHLGDIALIVGDIDGARTWYGRVLEADPRNEEIQGQLKSLESVTPAAAPTPMSTPAVALPPAAASSAAPAPTASASSEPAPAAAPETVPLPSLELTVPTEMPEPARTPAASAPTVVVPAIPMPAIERTVEIPTTPMAAPIQSLSTARTAEITLDQVPVPAVPDLDRAAEASSADLPVEKTPGFEPTAAASASEAPVAEPRLGTAPPAALETPPIPPIDSFTLEGLETTSMAPPPPAGDARAPATSELSPPAVGDVPPPEAAVVPATPPEPASEPVPAPIPDQDVSPAPVAEASPPTVAEPVPARESAPTSESAATAEPPASSGELTFLDVGETVQQPSQPSPEQAMAESKPFVTETMAELYEQQGHRDEALRVYRALLQQRPHDDHIRSRIEQLEGKRGPTIRELLSRVAARRPAQQAASPARSEPRVESVDGSPSEAIDVAAAAVATPSAPSISPAPVAAETTSDEATPAAASAAPPVPTAAAAQPGKSRRDLLGQLFGNAPVGGEDEKAAVTLCAAFSDDGRGNGSGSSSQQLPGAPARPASKDLSLDAVFGSEHASAPPASSFSFDQFFSERATAEQPAPGVRGAAEGQETKDDVAKFTQWLEGLKQR